MSDIAIHAEALGKKYTIGHQSENGRYLALRDVLMKNARGVWHKTKDLIRGRPIIFGDVFEEVWALKDVSFEINRGEAVGIIGRNGAGKSTLLKVLSRITEPSAGRVSIKGRVASLLEVGTGFNPELSGRENIFLNGAILGMSRQEIKRKLDEIVCFAEVEKFLDTPVKRYSSGMYVRLAFAVAAHLEPEILLVDEVLAVGDMEFQKKCLGRMGEVSKGGRTVLFVSHNMGSIVSLCQRAILLDAGKTVIDGKAAEVVQKYLANTISFGGEIVWADPSDAPGNDLVRLHAVRILQHGYDGPTAHVDISKDVHIQITYWVLKEGLHIYPAIWLRDQIGAPLLSSSNARSISLTKDPWWGCSHPKGLFQSTCCIPGNFLNEGMYSVTAIIGKGISETQILEDHLMSFNVIDTGEMRKEYSGRWVGAVRPRLAWNTEYLGESTEPAGNMHLQSLNILRE